MWSYYGSKSKIVDLYPPPKHKRIVEPFAGSARYSLKYWDREVLLMDKYDKIVNMWLWLQKASYYDVMNLPNMDNREHDRINSYDIPEEAKDIIGYCIGRGSPVPRNKPGKYNDWKSDKKRIADSLSKIKHWQIRLGNYYDIPNQGATWFIDPPYQYGGEYYKHPSKNINFQDLSMWCQSREGQIIVCENTKADWMPFKPMVEMEGSTYRTTEAIWSNHKTNYDDKQGNLFSAA